jgi:hypothetical protein
MRPRAIPTVREFVPEKGRNRIERFFNKIKHCRRVATRCDKLAANDFAFLQLASIRLWPRVNESASQRIARRRFASERPEAHGLDGRPGV